MKSGSIILGMLAVFGLGGVALAAAGKKQTAVIGTQFVLTYATSRPISTTDLNAIQQGMVQYYKDMHSDTVLQGIAITGELQFKVNVSFGQPDYAPKVGAVGMVVGVPNLTIQLTAVDKVS